MYPKAQLHISLRHRYKTYLKEPNMTIIHNWTHDKNGCRRLFILNRDRELQTAKDTQLINKRNKVLRTSVFMSNV